eukprot:12714-Heterococcus_DN1.PRE.4
MQHMLSHGVCISMCSTAGITDNILTCATAAAKSSGCWFMHAPTSCQVGTQYNMRHKKHTGYHYVHHDKLQRSALYMNSGHKGASLCKFKLGYLILATQTLPPKCLIKIKRLSEKVGVILMLNPP